MAYFSILIPVFNQVGKMEQCIESIREQTFGDYEVIFVNDGSTDDSLSMLDGYAAKDARCLVDSDDYVEKTMLEEIRDKYEQTHADIIRFGYIQEPEGRSWVPSPCDDLLGACLDGELPPAIWKNAYAARVIRSALETGEPFYCNMGEDSYLSTVFFGNAKSHAELDRALYHYEFVSGMSAPLKSNSVEKIKKQIDSVSASGQHLISFLERQKPDYIQKGKSCLLKMLEYVLIANIFMEKDPVNAVRCVSLFDQEDMQELFEKACRGLLRWKYIKPGTEGGFADQFIMDLKR